MSKSTFKVPIGVNYHCAREIPLSELSLTLTTICGFLQNLDSSNHLLRYEDWWEHDGLHFERGSTNMHEVFSLVETPRALFEAMPGDDLAFVGIAATDGSWYLRFYVNWDTEDQELMGRFDLTLPTSIAKEFEEKVHKTSSMVMELQNAEAYFKSRIR